MVFFQHLSYSYFIINHIFRRVFTMKKFFTGLCVTSLICFTFLAPLEKTSNVSFRDIGASTYGFYLAIEGQ